MLISSLSTFESKMEKSTTFNAGLDIVVFRKTDFLLLPDVYSRDIKDKLCKTFTLSLLYWLAVQYIDQNGTILEIKGFETYR